MFADLFIVKCYTLILLSRRRMEEVVRYHHRDSGNTSLNSVQLFVLGRMRDRPPRYDDVPDKPPEYDGPQDEIAALPLPRIPVVSSTLPVYFKFGLN